MVSFVLVGLWQFAAALRQNEQGRWRLALAGIAFGCAMACKWNAIPFAVLPGLLFAGVRLKASGRRFLWDRRAAPVRGISLIEAALWLGLLPLAVYAISYWPYLFYAKGSLPVTGLIELHERMLALQEKPLKPHTYQSVWWQWVLNLRGIWYLYEPVGAAQRGVVLIGNPLTWLLGLPALLWCLWVGLAKQRWDALAVATLYAVSLAFWIFAAKHPQFFYHYQLSSMFLMAALALALDQLWRRGGRAAWIPLGVLAASTALFVHFWPIISAAKLAEGRPAYEYWMWLRGWR